MATLFFKGLTKMTKKMDSENFNQKIISMKGISKMTKEMDSENLKQKMDSMKGNGEMIFMKVKEYIKKEMVKNILENLKMANIKDKEY